jgi:hypothetical protein
MIHDLAQKDEEIDHIIRWIDKLWRYLYEKMSSIY